MKIKIQSNRTDVLTIDSYHMYESFNAARTVESMIGFGTKSHLLIGGIVNSCNSHSGIDDDGVEYDYDEMIKKGFIDSNTGNIDSLYHNELLSNAYEIDINYYLKHKLSLYMTACCISDVLIKNDSESIIESIRVLPDTITSPSFYNYTTDQCIYEFTLKDSDINCDRSLLDYIEHMDVNNDDCTSMFLEVYQDYNETGLTVDTFIKDDFMGLVEKINK